MGDLARLFHPRSVAIVGASANTARLPGRPLPILQRHGFTGAIYPVNPRYAEVGGLTCYDRVSDIPGPVDVALIVVPAAQVIDVMHDCGKAGVGNAVVISSGFEETPEGLALGEQLKAAALEHGINVVGPNSEGVWSAPGNAILTFGSAALHHDITDGPVSVISQSGSIGGSTAVNLQRRGLGCRYFLSVGNETTLGTVDFLDYLVEEGGSRVITVYVEGLSGGDRLRDIAIRAARKQISIVLVRGGRSDEGRTVAATHTGKVATSTAVYSSILRQCGVIEVDSIVALLEAADVLLTAGAPRRTAASEGAGLAVIAPGGSRVLIADASAHLGVPLAHLGDETTRRLDAVVPAFGSVANPVDVTGQVVNDAAAFQEVVAALAADPHAEALLLQYSNRGLQRIDEITGMLGTPGLIPDDLPVVVGFLGDLDSISAEMRAEFRELGAVPAIGPEGSMRYLEWMYRARTTAEVVGASPTSTEMGTGPASKVPTRPTPAWTDQERFLTDCGVPVPRSVIVGASSWRDSIEKLRFPVVVKALPEDVAHKTDEGLVRLGIQNPAELGDTVARMLSHPTQRLDRLLVQEMAAPGVETLAALRTDPDFGPVLTVGVGGTLVELIAEAVHLSVPCSDDEILTALRTIRLHRLLADGPRGAGPMDVDAFVQMLRRLVDGYLALDDRPNELELNPVVVHPEGSGVTALDVLVVDRESGASGGVGS